MAAKPAEEKSAHGTMGSMSGGARALARVVEADLTAPLCDGGPKVYRNPRWLPGHLVVLSEDLIEFTWSGVGTVRLTRLKN